MNANLPRDPKLADEIRRARAVFATAAGKDEILGYLAIIDPLRALAAAKIRLSRGAQEWIRQRFPRHAYDNRKLFTDIRSGAIKLPWIRRVTISESSKVQPLQDR